jgi:hypothetical protein
MTIQRDDRRHGWINTLALCTISAAVPNRTFSYA